jgi:alkyl hydroperoxide reductase subunit AhpF
MILSERDRIRVQQMLGAMAGPVRLLFFTQTLNCDTCVQTRQILDELVPLGDKLSFEERNFILDKEGVEAYGVERVPAIVVLAGDRDTGIRFYGAPTGYEFSSLLDVAIAASTGQSSLSETSRAQLAAVTSPVRIQVFVTPT